MGEAIEEHVLESLRSIVMKESESLEGSCIKIKGYDFNRGVDYPALARSLFSTGFQAANLGEAIQVVNQMLDWRLSDEPITEDCNEEERDPAFRETVTCKVFLGFTSNLISSGVRDIIRYLVQHHMVDVVVTTAGGIEEDLIKCLAPTYKGDFSLPGASLRSKGLNRIGNLLVPNDNYCKFEDWIQPIFDQMLEEQNAKNLLWTPSKVNARLGKEINDERSYLYWAYKNNIPVFCPSLTDGSLGDMLYFHSFRSSGLVVDLVQDIRAVNGEAVHASPRKTGMIILGGGLPKHHICNANMMRNGADFAVYINTAQEFDGSDSGARPDEAVSWGKIRGSAKAVKVHCDATIAFPLLVAETFAQRGSSKKAKVDFKTIQLNDEISTKEISKNKKIGENSAAAPLTSTLSQLEEHGTRSHGGDYEDTTIKIISERLGELAKRNSDGLGEVSTAINKLMTVNQLDVQALYDELMNMNECYEEEFLGSAFDYLVDNENLGKGFLVKSNNLRRLWLDNFKKKSV